MPDKVIYKINGTEYHSLEEVPQEFRAKFSPENIEKMAHEGPKETITVNGIEYHSRSEVPEEFRQYIPENMAQQVADGTFEKTHPGSVVLSNESDQITSKPNLTKEESLLYVTNFTKPKYLLSMGASLAFNYLLAILLPSSGLNIAWYVPIVASLVIGHFSYVVVVLLFEPEKRLQNLHKTIAGIIFFTFLFNFFYHIALFGLHMLFRT